MSVSISNRWTLEFYTPFFNPPFPFWQDFPLRGGDATLNRFLILTSRVGRAGARKVDVLARAPLTTLARAPRPKVIGSAAP